MLFFTKTLKLSKIYIVSTLKHSKIKSIVFHNNPINENLTFADDIGVIRNRPLP